MSVEVRRQRIAAFLAQPLLARLLRALDGDGEETRVVGGSVRDLLLGEPVGDVDLATTALPEETMRRGRAAGFKAVPTGIDHGTVTLVGEGTGFEVTTLRRDVETDGRRATVAFGRDFVADALRRDFTVNALSLGQDGVVHDHCGGIADLAARRIRFIGDATTRIREDYLRILRFFRFHARFAGGPVDAEGFAACVACRAGLEGLSRERVRAELMKLLVAPGALPALRSMAEGGLLMPILGRVPLLSRLAAIAGDGGGGDVYPAFRLAALAVRVREDAAALRERLRLSNAEFDRIERLALALEALAGRSEPPEIVGLRRLGLRLGADAVAGALVLEAATAPAHEQELCRALVAELGRTPPFRPGGRETMARGVPAGPAVGRVLEEARRLWIEAGAPGGEEEQLRCVDAAVLACNIRGAG
ncbi:MAG: CCA tRNA nucleotidyltransferase [Chelatococcus sp.]|nr:MAG: CCA tRNA nucleotidyltransferase [Chelatococcus sp.]